MTHMDPRLIFEIFCTYSFPWKSSVCVHEALECFQELRFSFVLLREDYGVHRR